MKRNILTIILTITAVCVTVLLANLISDEIKPLTVPENPANIPVWQPPLPLPIETPDRAVRASVSSIASAKKRKSLESPLPSGSTNLAPDFSLFPWETLPMANSLGIVSPHTAKRKKNSRD